MNFRAAIAQLTAGGVPDPGGDVRRLYDWAFSRGGAAPEPQDRDNPNDMTLEFLEIALAERVRRKPVSQIIGKRSFWRHDFLVTQDVLDPRPDTETLIEAALGENFDRCLDLGTGSGAIAISLLADRPKARGVATDISDTALRVAAQNADRIGVADRLELIRSDWCAGVSGRFDLIVSNPPYIAADEMPGLAPEVRDWEPHIALSPGGDGLATYRAIAAQVSDHLLPGGRVLVEIGPSQAKSVSNLFTASGFDQIDVLPDLDGRDRVVAAKRGKTAK